MKNIYRIASLIIFIIPCILSVIYPSIISELVREGIEMCLKIVIPSLFLFMFLTKFLSESGISEKAGSVISPFFTKFLCIPKELCGAFLIGLAGGFPNGAEACGSVYENGKCSREMCEYTVCLSNNCSLAFVAAYISTILGSIKYSFIIFLSEFICIFITSLIFRKPLNKEQKCVKPRIRKNEKTSMRKIICKSVSSSVTGILNVCGYIIICYTLSGVILKMFPTASSVIKAVISGIFEISCGVSSAGNLEYPANLVFCSGIVGFSGLSVILQISDVSEKFGFSAAMFIKSRILNIFLMPTITVFIMLLLPKDVIYAFYGEYNGYIPEVINVKALAVLYVLYFACVMMFFALLYGVNFIVEKKRAKCTKKQYFHNIISH